MAVLDHGASGGQSFGSFESFESFGSFGSFESFAFQTLVLEAHQARRAGPATTLFVAVAGHTKVSNGAGQDDQVARPSVCEFGGCPRVMGADTASAPS